MKIKKVLSALLATAMVFALLCTPAFAAGTADTLAEINDNESIWVGVTDLGALAKEVTLNLRYWDYANGVFTKGKDSASATLAVLELPLGVTLAAGPNNKFLGNIWAYSDPDGDGIYDERMEKIVWAEDDTVVSTEIVPTSAEGPFTITDAETYHNDFDWGYGHNFLEASLRGTPGYHTLTTDHLVELFGANTLIIFWDDDEDVYFPFLLTGKEAPEGVVYSLEDQGVYFSMYGDVVSGWAVEIVNTSIKEGLYYEPVAHSHNFDLTGNITRGEFAILAVDLYEAMSGKTARYTNVDPFVDVEVGTYMYQSIMCARDLGIVQGTSTVDKTFEPDAPVTRQDAALMLSRVYTLLGGKIPAVTSTSFADNALIAPYAMDAVAFMNSKGIISGVGGNCFDPKGNTTVEQALKIALEMLNKL